MRRVPQVITVSFSVAALTVFGLTLAATNVGATGSLPTTINEIVAPGGTTMAVGCPAGLPAVPVYSNLASAVSAATSGQTIYVCAGTYDMSVTAAYGTDEWVDITKSLTIDGYNWNVPPSSSDTTSSVDSTSQSVFVNGSGFVVQSANVTISGLTFEKNNFNNPAETECSGGCASSVNVISRLSIASGDQGEPGATISNNLFVNTGGGFQNGVVHFGLGQNGSDSDVTALDANDVVEGNVFTFDSGYENNEIQMSDTTGALVTGNTVTYPLDDDVTLSAFTFTGLDQALTVSNNTLNGGGIDSDMGATPDTGNPKSGVKIIDALASDGNFGNGCSDQVVTGNTISGFDSDISLIGNGVNDNPGLCAPGPSDFEVTHNAVSDARLFGIFVTADATGGSILDNVASDTDTEGYATDGYSPGQYDYYDGAGASTTNTWYADTGNGSASPAGIEGAPPSPPPPTSTTTTTTEPPPSTTTTTIPSKPVVKIVATTLKSGGKVVVDVECANARCAGTLGITKKVTSKLEVLGRKSYALAAGIRQPFTIQLNALGTQLVRAAAGGHFSCVLTWTSAAGPKQETLSLRDP